MLFHSLSVYGHLGRPDLLSVHAGRLLEDSGRHRVHHSGVVFPGPLCRTAHNVACPSGTAGLPGSRKRPAVHGLSGIPEAGHRIGKVADGLRQRGRHHPSARLAHFLYEIHGRNASR